MSLKKLRIMDWYVHQGHQYEFFKTGHKFFLSSVGGEIPDWNTNHRPLNKNLRLCRESVQLKTKFDVVIVRSPLHKFRYNPFLSRNAVPVAVVQTTEPFNIPEWVRHIVWNSKFVMSKWKSRFPKSKHFYIPHGYDPDEFVKRDFDKNGRILSVLNVFKDRSYFLGYDIWKGVSSETGLCDIVGHGNDGMKESAGRADSLDELIDIYNKYSVFFNPTAHSAMPRSRAEAMMCGAPIVSTDNYDIGSYIRHRKDGFLTNDPGKLVKYLNLLLNDEDLAGEFGNRAREVAIREFHIKDYIDRWNSLLYSL
jgi:glycosyltransferase involved in cell wall biosynthesis